MRNVKQILSIYVRKHKTVRGGHLRLSGWRYATWNLDENVAYYHGMLFLFFCTGWRTQMPVYHVGCEKCSAQIQHESVRWAGLNMGQLHGHYSPAKWRLPCYCCWAFRGCGYLSLNTKKWRYVLDNVKQQNFLSHGIPLHLLGCGSGPSNSPSMTILTMSFGYLAPGSVIYYFSFLPNTPEI